MMTIAQRAPCPVAAVGFAKQVQEVNVKLLESDITSGSFGAMPKFEHFHTRDIDQARRWGESVFCQNELTNLDALSSLDANLCYKKFGNLGMGTISYGGEVTISPNEFNTFYLVQMPLHGGECIDSNNQRTYISQSVGCVLNAQHPVLLHHSANTKKIFLRVERELLERLCGQHLGRGVPLPIEFDTAMPLNSPAGKRWMQTMSWLAELLNEGEVSDSPLLAVQIEHMVATMLLECQHSNLSEALLHDSHKITPSFVRRAQQFLEERASEPITVCDIAEYVGVSTRSLYNGFQKYRHMSPMHMLKEIRLNRVREQLMQSQTGQTTVTAVAYQWGFCHLGHFTIDYKRRFGECPSDTLMR